MQILIADDSSVARNLLRRCIATVKPSAVIEECVDGETLGAWLSTFAYDLAFIDVHMPRMDGPQAVEKAQSAGRRPTVIFMSTDMSEDVTGVARKLGAFDFLLKPFRHEDVSRVLDMVDRVRQPTRLLLVDDSRTMREIMERIFERSQFNLEVKAVGSGAEAIDLCRVEAFKIVILDVNMPGIDGVETMNEIKRIQPQTKVVMISGEDRQQVYMRFGDAEFDGFLAKPFMPRDIDRVLIRMFGIHMPILLP